jgi:hypothetical protein
MGGMPLPRLRFRPRTKRPWRPRPISTWVLLWAGVAVIAGGWLYYSIQVSLINAIDAGNSPEAAIAIAQLRVDTVRNTLTVAAGLGGAAALILSFRRQQHEEYQSTQQRITELRIQAVAQLGSESPTVRIGGLHNLERLGEEHEELRQIVLDEICSYLRLPYTPPHPSVARRGPETGPPGEAAAENAARNAEREVRLIAQEILQRKLKTLPDRDRPLWDHNRLNLRNAFLDNINFQLCCLRSADFTDATFHGDAGFLLTKFGWWPTFAGAVFSGDADFRSAAFEWDPNFTRTTFNSDAFFDDTEFHGGPIFTEAVFSGRTTLARASMTEPGDFTGAFHRGDTAAGKVTDPESVQQEWLPKGWRPVQVVTEGDPMQWVSWKAEKIPDEREVDAAAM